MKGIIIFLILSTDSHLNATIKLSKYLSLKGYKVIYLGDCSIKRKVIDQGFDFHQRQDLKIFNKLANDNRYKKFSNKIFKRNFMRDTLLKDICKNYSPKLIIVDASLIYYTVQMVIAGIPFITFSTKVSQDFSPYVPPFTSTYVPSENKFTSKLTIRCIWILSVTKKMLIEVGKYLRKDQLSMFFVSIKYLMLKNIKMIKFIDIWRSGHFGWKNAPEIILSPRHFDFPKNFPDHKFHVGPVVDFSREINSSCSYFNSDCKTIKFYCATGSYDSLYFKERIQFFSKLIYYFGTRVEFELIISTGFEINPKVFKLIPNNVKIYKDVPQLQLIKEADFMINHGGMQSITECILFDTPMLVYPLNLNLDQNGNGSRVIYHQIGIRGDLRNSDIVDIDRDIKMVIESKEILKKRIVRLKNKILVSNDFEVGMKKLLFLIENKGTFNNVDEISFN